MNEDIKVKLTLKDDSPAYIQSLPTPINLKEDILVKLALLHRYGIITTLPFSKYASPSFAQKKPNGKLRHLVDRRKINTLISDDYINNNHPVSTLTDAAQHMAGKRLFCKVDCSQDCSQGGTIASRWLTRGQLKCWPSTLRAEHSPIADWHKASAELCQHFRALCANISIKLINAPNM